MTTTARIKRDLWRHYGVSPDWKAEWDGASYGEGGKFSQRMWEYLIAAELLDLSPESIVLDIGGGSPVSGMPFFAELIAPHVQRVVVMDPNQPSGSLHSNIERERQVATRESLKDVFSRHAGISHVCSISVFEHVEDEPRRGIIRGINDYFAGDVFVATYEYHPVTRHFEHQLTAESASKAFAPLTTFYLDRYVSSPTLCVNAFALNGGYLRGRLSRMLQRLRPKGGGIAVPLWYPCAVRFLRA